MKKQEYLRTGECAPSGNGSFIIKREWYGQGEVFKDEEAFYNFPDRPCYVAELSDNVYTARDLFKMCGQDEDVTRLVFDSLDWAHPETEIAELESMAEVDTCKACGKKFLSYEADHCPHCGEPYEYTEGIS